MMLLEYLITHIEIEAPVGLYLTASPNAASIDTYILVA
jgi:hypothetical protein